MALGETVGRCRAEALATATVLAVGVALYTLPHWWSGEAVWVADYDELAFYLPMAAAAYRDSPWRLQDPLTGGPTYYQPLSIAPGIVLAKLLGLGVWQVGLCWRLLGGVGVAAGWYFVLRQAFRPGIAAAATCLLLADPGVVHGQVGYVLLKSLLQPPDVADRPGVTPNNASLPQCRILNPALSWPWWLLFVGLMLRAVARRSLGRRLAAGGALGVLFYVYFYYWTAAVAGLALAALLDRANRRNYLHILGLGLLLGVPALLESMQFRAECGTDWLHRTDKFLPVGRGAELLLPRYTLLLLVLLWLWTWRRGRRWIWLTATTTATLLLLNQTAVTGLQIENFHWNFAMGPLVSLLTVLAAADLLAAAMRRWGGPAGLVATSGGASRAAAVTATEATSGAPSGTTSGATSGAPSGTTSGGRWAVAALVLAAVVVVAAGAWLYARAAVRLPENRRIAAAVTTFRAEAEPLAGQLWRMGVPPGSTAAGEVDFQYLAAIGWGMRPLDGYTAVLSPITNAELDERHALQAVLLGREREDYRGQLEAGWEPPHWGPEARSEQAWRERIAQRLEAYDRVQQGLAAYIRQYRVRVFGHRSPHVRPAGDAWRLVHSGDYWHVWVYVDPE